MALDVLQAAPTAAETKKGLGVRQRAWARR